MDTTFDAGTLTSDYAADEPLTLVARGVPAGVLISFGDRAEQAEDQTAAAVTAFLRFALAVPAGGAPPLAANELSVTRIARRDQRAPVVAGVTTAVHFFGNADTHRRHLYVCEGTRCVREGDDANVRTELVLSDEEDVGIALLVDASANLGFLGEAYGSPAWQLASRADPMATQSDCEQSATTAPCYRLTGGTAGIVSGSILVGVWGRAGDTRLVGAIGASFTPDIAGGLLFQGDARFGVEVFPAIFVTIGFGLRVVRAAHGLSVGNLTQGSLGADNAQVPPVLGTEERVFPTLTLGVAADLITLGKAATDLVGAL
ncbi:MAG: hypothetical protein AB7S26_35750 [Sandaracinaceae bacterium]